jgi:hypothetical protein
VVTFFCPVACGGSGAHAHSHYSALIGIAVPLDAAVFGRVMVSSPFLKLAVTLLASTVTGSLRLRANAP